MEEQKWQKENLRAPQSQQPQEAAFFRAGQKGMADILKPSGHRGDAEELTLNLQQIPISLTVTESPKSICRASLDFQCPQSLA